jgi:hypothetical protein
MTEAATGGKVSRDAERRMEMSALCQKQTSKHVRPISALPPMADIAGRDEDVRSSGAVGPLQ